MTSRERRVLAMTALLAVGAPVGAAWWIASRTGELADELSTVGGVRARIGTVDADLSGAVRLSDVAFGELFAADALEASVGMGSLLDGQLRADEIRVEGPHVAISIDPDGDSDLARFARRLSKHKPKQTREPGARPHIRRIVVADGTLVARIAGLGEVTADGVELLPDSTGIRVVTGPLRVRADHPNRQLHLELTFSRSAAEVSQQMKFGRVLAVGGAGTATTAGTSLALYDLAAGRRVAGGPFEIFAVTDDNGVARSAAVEIQPHDFTVTLRGDRFPLRAFAPLVPPGIDLFDTRATGSLVVKRRPAGGFQLSVDGALDRLVVADPRFAADPVPLSFAVRAEVDISAEAITVPTARLRLPSKVELVTSGWVRRGKPVSGQVELELVKAPCQALLAALPAPVRGPLDGMQLSGELGARARLTVDLAAPEGAGTTLTNALDGGCQVATEPPAADVTMLTQKDPIDQSLADGSRVRIGPNEPTWAALKSLPWYVPAAFTSAEDGRFWDHKGFDLEQIARSLEIDLREHRLARGGSTISQQLVKNVFLSQRRSFDRKLQEAILTWRLENKLDKKQILERYLNVIELGPRVWGLRAAAKHWFNVSPRELTVRQAAFLAALTSQPTAMARRVRKAGGTDPETNNRINVVLMAMRRDGVLDEPTFIDALNQRLYFATTAVPTDR